MTAAVLAHQGGWDEALFVVGPMLAIIALLWLAKRRADRLPPVTDPAANDQASPRSSDERLDPRG